MKHSFLKVLPLVILGVLIGTGVAWYQETGSMNGSAYSAMEPAAGETAAPGIGGDFTLTNHEGNEVTQDDFADAYKLVFFGFTNCPMICPNALQKITIALDDVQAEDKPLETLFITVDPERDTPAVMKSYLEAFHPTITGLTGTEDQIQQVEDAYKVYAAKVDSEDPAGYTMDHSAYIFLMSPEGEMITLFGSDDSPEKMAQDIEAALSQS